MSDRKRAKLDEAAVSAAESQAFEDLKAAQADLDQVNGELADKIVELEKQWAEKRAPVYSKRAIACRKIPGFWVKALSHHPLAMELIGDDDEIVLSHLIDLEVVPEDDVQSGYSIVFRFSDNPYLAKNEYTKKIQYKDDGSLLATTTPPLEWKDTEEGKQQRTLQDQRLGNAEDAQLSFFDWLKEDNEIPASEDEIIADAIKQDIWPDPLRYYSGEGLPQAAFDDLDEDEDEEDEDEGPTPDEVDL